MSRSVAPEAEAEAEAEVPTAAAVGSAAPAAQEGQVQQQQQQKLEARLRGLISKVAIQCRQLKRAPYDEAEELERFSRGEFSVEDLQQLSNELADELQGRST